MAPASPWIGSSITAVQEVFKGVFDLGDDFATLEVADGVQIKIRRQSVESILPKGSMKEM